MSTKVYVAGPMQGIPQFNFPAFDGAAATLRSMGYEVISPAELDDPKVRETHMASVDGKWIDAGDTWGTFLSRDVKIVADQVDGLVMLPGWERSKGARLEAFVGLCAKKRFAIFYPEFNRVSWVSNDFIREIIKGNMP